jgi:hypothetical protein
MRSPGLPFSPENTIPMTASQLPSMSIAVPPFAVQPGQSQTQAMTIRWEGAAKIIITDIELDSDQPLIKIGVYLPYAAGSQGQSGSTEIPLTVSIPTGQQTLQKVVQMRITAIIGGNSVQQVVPVMIDIASTN